MCRLVCRRLSLVESRFSGTAAAHPNTHEKLLCRVIVPRGRRKKISCVARCRSVNFQVIRPRMSRVQTPRLYFSLDLRSDPAMSSDRRTCVFFSAPYSFQRSRTVFYLRREKREEELFRGRRWLGRLAKDNRANAQSSLRYFRHAMLSRSAKPNGRRK